MKFVGYMGVYPPCVPSSLHVSIVLNEELVHGGQSAGKKKSIKFFLIFLLLLVFGKPHLYPLNSAVDLSQVLQVLLKPLVCVQL